MVNEVMERPSLSAARLSIWPCGSILIASQYRPPLCSYTITSPVVPAIPKSAPLLSHLIILTSPSATVSFLSSSARTASSLTLALLSH